MFLALGVALLILPAGVRAGAFACLLVLIGCGGPGPAGNVGAGAGNGAAVPAPACAEPAALPEEPAPRDVSRELLAVRDVIFIRETRQSPQFADNAQAARFHLGVETAIAEGLELVAPDLERTARALSPELPFLERVRVLVLRADELTGWDQPGIVPYKRPPQDK